ncbi:doublecortin domain-containing protein 1 isoform X3 [Passer montanus]|uniref:doublecortin domain-containing protein 1 isoform X3 n=1 Tax=Passer montanus TaxID=9160 RepID=UPI00196010FB|nr:doublecortin domain-containing protein 1 isoform X3 [Passer montanus]
MNLALTQASLLDRRLQNVITPLCGPVWVFERGGFSPSGAEIYIRGVLLALHQRVKPAKCCKQAGDAAVPVRRRKCLSCDCRAHN